MALPPAPFLLSHFIESGTLRGASTDDLAVLAHDHAAPIVWGEAGDDPLAPGTNAVRGCRIAMRAEAL